MEEFNKLWNALIDAGLFTEKELQLITCINGCRVDVLNDCIFARYGYRDFEQMMEEDF